MSRLAFLDDCMICVGRRNEGLRPCSEHLTEYLLRVNEQSIVFESFRSLGRQKFQIMDECVTCLHALLQHFDADSYRAFCTSLSRLDLQKLSALLAWIQQNQDEIYKPMVNWDQIYSKIDELANNATLEDNDEMGELNYNVTSDVEQQMYHDTFESYEYSYDIV